MTEIAELRRMAPAHLGAARDTAHRAIQHLTRAARANLSPAPDDSHSNLEWIPEHRALVSQPIASPRGPLRIGLSIVGFELFVQNAGAHETLGQLDGHSDEAVAGLLDQRLAEDGLVPSAVIALPYELPPAVAAIDSYDLAPLKESTSVLAAWYDLAASALENIAKANRHIAPGPSPVRCWPHHFDIATYLSLEEGDFEAARGIGIGMSPGDESYGEPYFYVNPWPHLDPAALPKAPAPGHWHTDGFVGAIATASEITSVAKIQAGLAAFLESAVSAGRDALAV